ncbi:MAG: nucleotide sugar dehydrogenase [Syntrophales bacterium]|nr:nucleotide sugar dehydrogenase [Syntrophales bacterium]
MWKRTILCIGAGHVGGPTMAVIAKKCPEYRVTVVDIDAQKIAAWNSDRLPIYEPGLEDLIRETRNRNLFFSKDIAQAIRDNDIIFVSVNTPTKTYGVGAGMAADLQFWEKTAREILENSSTSKIVVEKSTVPVKTALAMERILNSHHRNIHFDVISNPEFLSEGSAIRDLEFPDRVLIGYRKTESGEKAKNTIVEIYRHWVPEEKILTMDTWSSELSKLVSNAFLAQRVSSINAVSAICEKTDADITMVAKAVGMDSRIGNKFLNASVGFGGSCFKKDILNLVYLCRYYGLDEVADYWEGIVRINEFQQKRFVANMLNAMFNSIAGKRICLFGFSFKANTADTRESPALYIARRLIEEQAQLVITDPYALENAKRDLLGEKSHVEFTEDPYVAAKDAHAIAIMTEWDIYRTLDFKRIYENMCKPAFIFDGRNILDHEYCHSLGFNVYAIGKPPMTHFKEA